MNYEAKQKSPRIGSQILKEYLYLPSIVMKASRFFPMSKYDEASQHVNSTNIPGQNIPNKEIIVVCGNNRMSSDIHPRKEDN